MENIQRIINMMVQMIKPTLKDIICDPATLSSNTLAYSKLSKVGSLINPSVDISPFLFTDRCSERAS